MGVFSVDTHINFLSPLSKESSRRLKASQSNLPTREVFGFAPHWTLGRLENVDFSVLTTLAYFGVSILPSGGIDKSDIGYEKFKSEQATRLFQKAHDNDTRVVLTITQMDNRSIKRLLDSLDAQAKTVDEAVEVVTNRGIDGVNVDFEYVGDPGDAYRAKFTTFTRLLTERMHSKNPHSRVTVSVYASAVRYPKIYNIGELASFIDGIFMMAYDFAVHGSDTAMPTSPLYGHSTGEYWYDISTAVDDFLTQMPSNKLILGLPWYGYDYPVYSPEFKAATHKGYYVYSYVKTKKGKRKVSRLVRPESLIQTVGRATEVITSDRPGYQTGWDSVGQVGWKAYTSSDGTQRMVYLEDSRSLAIKYDFAKEKKLGGIGMWALGFEGESDELWGVIRDKIGVKDHGNI